MAIRKLKVSLNAPDGALALAFFARDLISRFEGNPKVPSPPVPIATVKEHLAGFEDANAKVGAGTMTATERDVFELALRNDLQAISDYAQMLIRAQPTVAEGEAMAASLGLSLRKQSTYRRGDFDVKAAGVGAVIATVKAASGPVTYYWQYSADGETWIDAPDTLVTKITISGLASHKLYYFRSRRLTRDGVSAWSQVVTQLVA